MTNSEARKRQAARQEALLDQFEALLRDLTPGQITKVVNTFAQRIARDVEPLVLLGLPYGRRIGVSATVAALAASKIAAPEVLSQEKADQFTDLLRQLLGGA